jgi:hypothetical protein
MVVAIYRMNSADTEGYIVKRLYGLKGDEGTKKLVPQ